MGGSDDQPTVRDAQGRFAAGNRGRPFGTRNRVSKRVARMTLRDFEAHQADLLPRLRQWFLPQYLALVARLMPRVSEAGGMEVDAPLDTLGELETAALIAQVREALERVEAGEATLAELESAFLGEERHNSGAVTIGG
jgi:hypothetical protein